MPKQSHTIFSVLRRGGVLPRPREGQSPPYAFPERVGRGDPRGRPPTAPLAKTCHCEPVTDVTGVAIRNIPYLTPPVSLPPGRTLCSTARVSGK